MLFSYLFYNSVKVCSGFSLSLIKDPMLLSAWSTRPLVDTRFFSRVPFCKSDMARTAQHIQMWIHSSHMQGLELSASYLGLLPLQSQVLTWLLLLLRTVLKGLPRLLCVLGILQPLSTGNLYLGFLSLFSPYCSIEKHAPLHLSPMLLVIPNLSAF